MVVKYISTLHILPYFIFMNFMTYVNEWDAIPAGKDQFHWTVDKEQGLIIAC